MRVVAIGDFAAVGTGRTAGIDSVAEEEKDCS